MSRSARVVAGTWGLMAALGCIPPPPGPPDGGPPDGGEIQGPALVGEVRDEAGQLVPRLQVLACQLTLCLYGASGDDGRFAFPVEPPAEIALKTPEKPDATPRRGAALFPVRISGQALVDVGTLWVPTLPQGAFVGPATLDPQTLAVGDGLELTVRRADLSPPLGVLLSHIGARAVPSSQIPSYPDLAGEEVIAVFALSPFATKSSSPIAVRVPSSLSPGTRVRLRTINELNGRFSEPIPGTADGAFVTSDPSLGIEELTRLVISR